MSNDATDWGLAVSFAGLDFGDSAEHAFVHGVEFGQLWQRMRHGSEAEIDTTIHVANRAAIERACAADGWSCEITDSDVEGWAFASLKKTAKAGGNPHGLRLVKN